MPEHGNTLNKFLFLQLAAQGRMLDGRDERGSFRLAMAIPLTVPKRTALTVQYRDDRPQKWHRS